MYITPLTTSGVTSLGEARAASAGRARPGRRASEAPGAGAARGPPVGRGRGSHVIHPRHLQLADIRRSDLRERREAHAAGIVAVGRPFLRGGRTLRRSTVRLLPNRPVSIAAAAAAAPRNTREQVPRLDAHQFYITSSPHEWPGEERCRERWARALPRLVTVSRSPRRPGACRGRSRSRACQNDCSSPRRSRHVPPPARGIPCTSTLRTPGAPVLPEHPLWKLVDP